MNNKVVAGASAFISGLLLGSFLQARSDRKRIIKVVPLVTNAIGDVLGKAYAEDLEPAELKKRLNEELKFIKIVMR